MGVSMRINLMFIIVLMAAIANQSGKRCIQLLDEDYFKSFFYGALAVMSSIVSILCLDIIQHNPSNSHDFSSLSEQYFYQKRRIIYGRWLWKRLQFSKMRSQPSRESKLLESLQSKKTANKYGYRQIPNIEFFQDKIPFSDYSEVINLKSKSQPKTIAAELPNKKYKALSLMEYISSKNRKNRLGRPLVMLQGCYNIKRISPLHYQTDFLFSTFRHHTFWCYPKEVFEISEEETYLYLVAIYSLKEREVSHIVAYDSSLLYAFWCIVSRNWSDICDIIESGIIPSKLNMNEESLQNITENFRADYVRAEELRNEFKKGFVGIASRLWPTCSYIQTLNMDSFSPEWNILLNRELKDIPLLASCYYMDSDLVSVPERLNSDNYHIPNLQSYFVEWISERDLESDWPDTIMCDEVETGKSYEMVLTSYDCQFVRCRTGVMVNIVNTRNDLPAFSFAFSNDLSLSIEDETTRVDMLGEILKGTCNRLGGSLVNFAATESVTDSFNIESLRSYRLLYAGIGRVSYHYVVFIEVEKPLNEQQYDNTQLLKFDKDLCLTFSPYQRMRKRKKLAAMKVIEVEPGTFQQLRNTISRDCKAPPCNTPKLLRTPKYLEFLVGQSKANSYQFKKSGGRRY